jgi:glycosyltransferase involved in cell wall biosynthesis
MPGLTDMTTDYPKVLLVGGGFNQVNGTGITLSNLFHGWPAENLAVIHNSPYENDPDRAIQFRLSMELALPLMRKGIEWKTRAEIQSASSDSSKKKASIARRTTYRDVLKNSLEYLGVTGLIRQFPLNNDLMEFVNEFQPDVFYTLLGDIPMASLFINLLDYYSLPSVVHIMDDYPSTIYRNGLFAGMVRKKMHAQLKQIFSLATMRLGISEAMCNEYSERYGQEFTPFHNPVDLAVWKSTSIKDLAVNKTSFTIAYSGRIGVSCLTSIHDVCNVIEKWSDPLISLTFNIHVNDISQAFEAAPFLKEVYPNIHVTEAPRSAEAVASLLAKSDILLFPVDFERESIEYIRLSMPTKVPAYMATGVPILVYGPPDVASVQYAKREGWGYVVDEQSAEALATGVLQLCTDKELRARLSRHSHDLAAKKHEAALVRNLFRESIVAAISSH